jgi:hypothetical protein
MTNKIITDKIGTYLKNNINNTIKLVFTKKIITEENNNFIVQTDIFNNIQIMEKIEKIEKKLKQNNINYLKKDIIFIRNHYYSQICDKLQRDNNIYTEELIFIDKISDENNDIFIFKTEKIQQHLLSFPNLNKYHYTNKINASYIDIDNIRIIIENNNIFIEIKDKLDNLDNLTDILYILLDKTHNFIN